MMYSAPDYEKVALNAADTFASYAITGCPQDEGEVWTFVSPCKGTDQYQNIYSTFTGLGWGSTCFSTNKQ